MVDLSPEMLRRAAVPATRTRTMRCCGVVERLPLKGGRWNAVFCIGLFPHLTDRRAALEEIQRVLVPGGRLAILHLIGREKLNALHREIGGVIAGHLLPPGEEVARLLAENGFRVGEILDREDCYQVTGTRL